MDWYGHYLAGEGEWERRGEPVAEVICDMASITPEMATDIRKILSDKYGYVIMREEFKGDPFGLEAKYEEQGPDHRLFKNAWEAFCDELTFRMRFFSPVAQGTLTEILGDLATLKTHDDEPVIRDIDPGEDGALVWRGRIAQSEDQLKAILKSPAQELAPPPPNLTVSGRMNVHGIPVFYGALDQQTCVAEVRAPVGSRVVIGKFEILRPIKVLDLSLLANAYAKGSYFDPSFASQANHAAFLRRLVAELSRPITPGEEAFEYLPTQAVAEYLAHKTCPRLDGIIFRSSQNGETGQNLVLFNHAASVRSRELPPESDVEVYVDPIYDDDDEEIGDTGSFLVVETVISRHADEDDCTGPTVSQPTPSVENTDETLLLDLDSVEVLEIRGVSYSYSSTGVQRVQQTTEERDSFPSYIEDPDRELDPHTLELLEEMGF